MTRAYGVVMLLLARSANAVSPECELARVQEANSCTKQGELERWFSEWGDRLRHTERWRQQEVAYADAEATCRISKARMATCRGDQMRNMGMARPAVFIRSRNLFKVIAVHPVFVSPWPAMGGDKPLPQITLDFIETCAASLEGKRVGRCACTCRRLGWNACVWVDDMDRVWADKYCPTGTGENRP